MLRLWLLSLLIVGVAATDAVAGAKAVVKCDHWPNSSKRWCAFDVAIEGPITSDTAKEVNSIFTEHANWKTIPDLIGIMATINSPGGDVRAAMEIGLLLRSQAFPIHLKKGDSCVSACVLILAGATDRSIEGSVGIHRPYFAEVGNNQSPTSIQESYRALLATLRQYLLVMNIRESLADEMLRIEPAQMKYLTESELDYFGLNRRDPAQQEYYDLKEAAEYKLSRIEFIQRKAIAQKQCGSVTLIAAWRACYDAIMKKSK